MAIGQMFAVGGGGGIQSLFQVSLGFENFDLALVSPFYKGQRIVALHGNKNAPSILFTESFSS